MADCPNCEKMREIVQPDKRDAVGLLKELVECGPYTDGEGGCSFCSFVENDSEALDHVAAHGPKCEWRRAKEYLAALKSSEPVKKRSVGQELLHEANKRADAAETELVERIKKWRDMVREIQAHIEAGGANPRLTEATVLCSELLTWDEKYPHVPGWPGKSSEPAKAHDNIAGCGCGGDHCAEEKKVYLAQEPAKAGEGFDHEHEPDGKGFGLCRRCGGDHKKMPAPPSDAKEGK